MGEWTRGDPCGLHPFLDSECLFEEDDLAAREEFELTSPPDEWGWAKYARARLRGQEAGWPICPNHHQQMVFALLALQ